MIVSLPPMLSRPDRKRHHAPEVFGSSITSYASTFTSADQGMPQVILVEVPGAGDELRAHYHASDQFQLVVEGSGTLGAHGLEPISLHYTNRYTGYGPIIAGPAGIAYYVFRPSFDPLGLGQYLHDPPTRERLKQQKTKKRNQVKDAIPTRSAEELRSIASPQVERFFGVDEPEPDAGLFADEIRLGPGMRYRCPDPASGGGQLLYVVAGQAQYNGASFAPRAAIAVTREESAITVQAGQDGLQALILQYPRW